MRASKDSSRQSTVLARAGEQDRHGQYASDASYNGGVETVGAGAYGVPSTSRTRSPVNLPAVAAVADMSGPHNALQRLSSRESEGAEDGFAQLLQQTKQDLDQLVRGYLSLAPSCSPPHSLSSSLLVLLFFLLLFLPLLLLLLQFFLVACVVPIR